MAQQPKLYTLKGYTSFYLWIFTVKGEREREYIDFYWYKFQPALAIFFLSDSVSLKCRAIPDCLQKALVKTGLTP